VSSQDEPMLRRYRREIDGVLIHVPTLHALGEADPWRPSNESLFGLCTDALATRIEHSGGHEVPKSPSFTSEMGQTQTVNYVGTCQAVFSLKFSLHVSIYSPRKARESAMFTSARLLALWLLSSS
jgi:hypothetical protein